MLAGPPQTVAKARKLRRSMSVPEVILWTRLRLRPDGFKFRRQHPAGAYVLDFFCNEARLAIEVDGISHDMGERPAVDATREQWLASQGVGVLRIAAADLSRNVDVVVQTIVDACSLRSDPLHHRSRDGPPPPFRGGDEVTGYSARSLASKLGLKPGQRVWRDGMPASVAAEIGDTGTILLQQPERGMDAAHIFKTDRAVLADDLAALRRLLAPSGFVWVSWPKKASNMPTDIDENVIRDICLPMGFVDVKVCAVDATWSGLKLVIRKDQR